MRTGIVLCIDTGNILHTPQTRLELALLVVSTGILLVVTVTVELAAVERAIYDVVNDLVESTVFKYDVALHDVQVLHCSKLVDSLASRAILDGSSRFVGRSAAPVGC